MEWRYFFILISIINGVELGVSNGEHAPDFNCVKSNRYSFAIPRCHLISGGPDPHCGRNLKNAHAAGLKTHLYLYPCVRCGNATKQAMETIAAVGENVVEIYWLVVEKSNWHADKAANRKFILELVNALKRKGKKPGISTNYNSWEMAVGLDWSEISTLPLWYLHNNNKLTCSDIKPFGGWKKPMFKRYRTAVSLCNGYYLSLSMNC